MKFNEVHFIFMFHVIRSRNLAFLENISKVTKLTTIHMIFKTAKYTLSALSNFQRSISNLKERYRPQTVSKRIPSKYRHQIEDIKNIFCETNSKKQRHFSVTFHAVRLCSRRDASAMWLVNSHKFSFRLVDTTNQPIPYLNYDDRDI